jgi:hypothetical protein
MTDVPFAAVSGDASAAYSRCGTMSAVGNLKTAKAIAHFVASVWLKAPNILSYSWRATTSGPIVTGQSRARMTNLRDWPSSARCFPW